MSFDKDSFVSDPSQEKLNLAKKTDLLNLASHYGLSETSMRKQEILNSLVRYFVEDDILVDAALHWIKETDSDFKLKELQIQL